MSHAINTKQSMLSLVSNAGTRQGATMNYQQQQHHHLSGGVSSTRYLSGTNRPCANCTCSPGLLSRQSIRSSSYLKRMSISRMGSYRSASGTTSPIPSENGGGSPKRASSVFTSDTSCDPIVKEINTSFRLESIRKQMVKHDIELYIIPSEDAHQSEYTSLPDQRRSFISGFSGSAGVAIITRDILCMNDKPEGLSALSTDGRYFTQASNELDFNWQLLKQGVKGQPTWEEWTIDQAYQMSLDSGKEIKIGIDPTLITYENYKNLNNLISSKIESSNNKIQIKLVPVKDNLIDLIWSNFEEKPIRKFNELIQLDLKYTGESTISKVERVRQELINNYNSDLIIINSLDEIAWILNLRGSDIEFNPVFYSYLILKNDKLILYTDNHERFNEINNLKNYLNSINCELKKYDDIWFDIRKFAIEYHSANKNLLITKTSSWKMVNCIMAKNFIEVDSPIVEFKSIKNEIELNGAKLAHEKDGLAIIKFFAWLEDKLVNDSDLISEIEASDKLLEIRTQFENFVGLSFETISSTGSNAAIIHYSPKRDSCSMINPNKIYLCDSGSQFLEGTTDTTRTFHFTEPRQEEIDNFTYVLKGHIALANVKFPENTTGLMIDCIARQFLWNQGLDYAHGTGHGVGAFLNVHEGPMGIGIRKHYNDYPLKIGNLMSNEPGYYKVDEYGIRIENMVFVKKSDLPNFNGRKFMEFENVTMVPYCKKLINIKLLTDDEKLFINAYHKKIWDCYHGKLIKHSWEYKWLKRETCPL
ncbi:unnamed protein product [[Candida] boidinii]|uniref:Xaa-Pro aminopeptidase n=1 Tax=Candida boidinii TaxID=5477 RepID=A0A9W6T3Z1_CANBO|nr:unnamed protein product [[Candida] boidinii]